MNILVVDDDHDLCAMLSRFLEKNGYRVYSAQDALQALDVLGRETIHLVITDYQMPHMDGIRFTETIRKDRRYKDLSVIMMTAHPNPDEISDKGLRKGVAMLLSKPIDFQRLLVLVGFAR